MKGYQILTMGCKISDAPDRIALYFNVRTTHLADERVQTTEFHNQQLVIG